MALVHVSWNEIKPNDEPRFKPAAWAAVPSTDYAMLLADVA